MPTNKKQNIACDNVKYLKIQKAEIQKRMNLFGGKLYLEFGGKLFDDYHASRVLPGFKPDSKLQLLLTFKNQAEMLLVVNARDIISNKVRNDLRITYQSEVERLIDAYQESGLHICGVVMCFYEDHPTISLFINKLNKNGIKVYRHYEIEGYPQNISNVFGENGFLRNEYIETTRPLVVVTAPGPGSGKMATCLSQLYHDMLHGIKSGYAKYETFPIWNLPLKHPVHAAYEAATVDLADVNMIDPYHLEAYGITATNYNRDIESFPLLKSIFEKIYGQSPYLSPTDMGVNMLGFSIVNDDVAREASKQEIIRRYYQIRKSSFLGKINEDVFPKMELIMTQLSLSTDQRKCVAKCLEKQNKTGEPCVAIELHNGKIVVGKRSSLLGASAAALLNALKTLGKIDDSLPLISPGVAEPIRTLKTGPLHKQNPRIRAEEILIALAIQANTNPLADLALKQLEKLRGCQVHSSCVLSEADLKTLNSLGMNVTEEPIGYAHKLYFK